MDGLDKKIASLEKFMGFRIKKERILAGSEKPFDETFSYNLCQRFYGKEKELMLAIKTGNEILLELIGRGGRKQVLCWMYSLVGNMYYILGKFETSTGYFMKVLSLDREDISGWMELMFSLRAMGKFEMFEKIDFNIELLSRLWAEDRENEMNRERLVEILGLIE